MPRHRAPQRPWWRRAREVRPRLADFVKLVDVGTRLTHLLTRDAHAEGVRPKGRYWALCGADVLPAAMVDPGSGRYCHACLANAVALPLQRRSSR